MSRPTKLTPEVRETIVEAIRKGVPARHAAQLAGITESTFHNWISSGKVAKSGRFLEFLESIKRAEAEAIEAAVGSIRTAMPDDWRAAMTYLERRYPEDWARRQVLVVEQEPEQPKVEDAVDSLVDALSGAEAPDPDAPGESQG